MSDTAILEATFKLPLIESDSISPIFSANYNFMFLGLWMYALKTVQIATTAGLPSALCSPSLHDGKILHGSFSLPLFPLLQTSWCSRHHTRIISTNAQHRDVIFCCQTKISTFGGEFPPLLYNITSVCPLEFTQVEPQSR